MAVHSHTRYTRHPALPRWRTGFRLRLPEIDWRPRRCMVVSVSLIFLGIGVPALMALGLIPVNFLLCFLGFGLAATGGVLALIFCGEI
jgi:hypothetical protein